MLRKIIKSRCFLFVIMFLVIHMAVGVGYYNAHAISKAQAELEKSVFFNYSNKNQNTKRVNKSKTSSELLEEKIKKLYNLLENETAGLDNNNSSKSMNKINKEIKELDKQITKEFKQTGKMLKRKNVSSEILKRHEQFVAKYKENISTLTNSLELDDDKQTMSMSVVSNGKNKKDKLKKLIKNKWLKKEFNPFKTNEFPKNNVDLNAGEPRNYEPVIPAYEYNKDKQLSSGNDQSSIDTMTGSNISTVNYATTSSDLEETMEIKFTPEIKDLARQLDHNPVKIYEYVKNNFDYEPYYGSVKGAQETLWQKAGNDFDQASLLISLFRESGIPARYVYGVVRVPIEKAKNWLGINDNESALTTFSSGGIPTTSITVGGKVEYVEFEHTWVEACVPLTYYRGYSVDDSGKGWVPLDPSFKQYEEIEGANLEEEVPFDAEGLINELESRANIGDGGASVSNIDQEYIQTQLGEYQQSLKTYLENNYEDSNVEEILGGRKIKQETYSILPLSLPYEVNTVHSKLSSLNDSYRQMLEFSIGSTYDLSTTGYTAAIPELAGKRISLSYVAASETDAELIASYLPEAPEDGSEIDPEDMPDNLPAYLIKVKPQIMVDGEVKAEGFAITMGEIQDFYMNFTYPEYALNTADRIHNEITAGGQYVINLDTGKVSQDQLNDKLTALKTTKNNLENEEYDKINPTSISGDLLHSIGLSYFAQLDMFNELLEKKSGVKSTRITSAGITAIDLDVGYLFGMPKNASAGGLSIDVDRNLHTIQSVDGDEEKVKAYNMVSGQISSYLEGGVFQQMFGGEAVSTMHILQKANMQGIKIYQINQDNVDSVIPQLQYSSSKKQMFKDLINSGKEITVPEQNVTIGGWQGTGYISLNPENGTGAYMIDGGLSGGRSNDTVTATPWLDFLIFTVAIVAVIYLIPYIAAALLYSITILSIMVSSGFWAQVVATFILSVAVSIITSSWWEESHTKSGICGVIGLIITKLLEKMWESIVLSNVPSSMFENNYIYVTKHRKYKALRI